MLELKGITKDYLAGNNIVQALKGVDIAFRKSEFVSILGPSGCGKTTLLNIIGGLDKYTEGELFIDNISTKDYTDRDWDSYRNKRIGFVFQSYNLIPHQTISENVELALAISGIDKAERVKRAHEALDKVGLQNQYNKKPNQLSGGQCQRVAIARAIVNNPEILLADEPTGALDTVTSVQIMDLIKEISSECLVIMVTHNPELAEQYSTRIIRLLDGEVVADSAPFVIENNDKQDLKPAINEENNLVDIEKEDNIDKLSAQKDIAEKVEDNIQDISYKGEVLEIDSNDKINEDFVKVKSTQYLSEENIATEQIEDKEVTNPKNKKEKKAKLSFWTAFKLSFKNLLSKRNRTIMVSIAGSIGIIGVSLVLAVSSGVQGYIRDMQNDMLSGNPITVSEQAYDLSAMMEGMSFGEKTEIIEKSVENGYINVDNVIKLLVERSGSMSAFQVSNNITKDYVNFVKAMPKEYYAAISTDYGLNLSNNLYTDFKFDGATKNTSLAAANQTYRALFENAVADDENAQFKNFSDYFSLVTESFKQAPNDKDFILSQYDIISDASSSKIAQEADEIMIVVNDDSELSDLLLAQYGYFSQKEFFNIVYKAIEDDGYNESLWKDKFSYDELLGKKFVWYPNRCVYKLDISNPTAPKCSYNPYSDENWKGKELKITAILKPKEGTQYGSLKSGFYYTQAFAEDVIESGKSSQIVQALKFANIDTITSMKVDGNYQGITYNFSYWINGVEYANNIGLVGNEQNLSSIIGSMTGQNLPKIYTLTLRELGGVDLPKSIKIYPTNFDYKDEVTAYLKDWNSDKDIVLGNKILKPTDREKITYTDNLAIVIGMINGMIDIVTAALIAFTALSLVVSTVMIAIITYVSVIERIKEIGVIRSLGGRKKDVSALFNAETFIIGSSSGIIGLLITYIISFIINQIVGHLFGIYTLASLPILGAVIMLVLSIGLTMLAGIIPASLAARKDPVNALRSE